jgi:hypothetical protein
MSVLADFGVSGQNPSTVGGVGTTPKYFPRALGSQIGVQSTTPSATSAVGQLAVPAGNQVHGNIFRVKAAGDCLPFIGGGNVTIDIVANTGTIASPTYSLIATTGAQTVASATAFPWFLEAVLVGDNYSGANPGTLAGAYWGAGFNGGSLNLIDWVPIPNQLSNLDFVKGPVNQGSGSLPGVVFGLVARVTFNVSLAQNFARLTQFQVTAD